MNRNFRSLLIYRRSVFALYARARDPSLPLQERWRVFREERDRLFATHPQSALTQRQRKEFTGLSYFEYDPALRFVLEIDENVTPFETTLELGEDGPVVIRRVGRVSFHLNHDPVLLG